MKYLSLLPIILLGMSVPVLCAQEATPGTAATQAATPVPELQEDPQITEGKLENGVRYIIRPTAEPQGRASVRLYVNAGSLDEQEHEKGISHLIEHLVFNGSRNFKRGELIPTMQQLGLGFGGDANAYTSLLETVYMLDLPNLKEETVNFAFTIMRDFADGATLEDSAIDHERGIVKSELHARDSASYRAMIAMLRHTAPGTRLADYLPIGTEEVIMGAPYEVFRNYYKTHYVPRNMTVVVTGDFEPATARQWVEKHFASMVDTTPAARIAPGTPDNLGPADTVVENPENALMNLTITVSNPWVQKPDTAAQRMEDLPLELACAMLNRRLSHLAREADSAYQHAGVSKAGLFTAADLFSMGITSAPEKWQAAMESALLELRRACQYGFSPAELAEITARIRATYTRAQSTWDTANAASMADRIIDSLSEKTKNLTPAEEQRVFEAGLARIVQNPDVCREALAKAFDAARAKLMLSGARVQGISGSDLRSTYDKVMQQKVTPPVMEELPPLAYENIGTPGSIEQQAIIEDQGITTLTLSNGVRVNLKPVDFSKGNISVKAYIDGGSLRLAHTPGLATLASHVMNQGGLEAHELTELEKILAGRNVGMSFGMGADRFCVSGNTIAADFEMQCKLLAAMILHPGFRNDGEIQLRRQLSSIYNRYETTPNGAYSMQAPKLMYGNDARFTTPERAQLESCTTGQVKAALSPWLQNGAMEVSIVGDFKVDEVLPVIRKTFGAMPARQRDFTALSEAETRVTNTKWGQREFLPYTTELDKTIVTQVRPCGDGMDQRRNRRLAVLTSIAREKLFDGIRAQLGETYSPSVRLATNPSLSNAATISTASAGVVSNRVKVNTAMDAILLDLGQGKITQADLDCALRPYIARTQKSLRTTAYWESALARLQSDPRQLPLIRDNVEDVKSITLEEIQQLAREVFGAQNEVNYFFTMPESAVKPKAPEPPPAEGYTIISSANTMADPDWAEVAMALKKKYPHAEICTLAELNEESIAKALRSHQARYAACVLRPEEVDRPLVNDLHRAARRVDDDPWGDCIWGIITGHSASDARRIAEAGSKLTIKRLLATTNVDHNRFEHSCCITDWTDSPVREQSGYTEPTSTIYPAAPGNDQLLSIFTQQLATQKPQLVITSSHATQFNLEMPFSRGLIFSYNNQFHELPGHKLKQFSKPLKDATRGDYAAISEMASQSTPVAADGEPRVWLAAGNCLFGNAQRSPHSMAATALSAYTCNQVVGYTVTTWYGAAGWGTLGTFFGNTNGTSLAEAWFLNNQFLLHRTQQLHPALLNVRFNGQRFKPVELIPQFFEHRIEVPEDSVKDMLGLVHDRDVLAFFGDPAWRAELDTTHAQSPYSITWKSPEQFTITANYDTRDRCAVWFPTAETGRNATGCTAPGAIFTNDFILFPTLELKKGESLTVEVK